MRMVSPATHADTAAWMLAHAAASLYAAAVDWRVQVPPLVSIQRFAVCAEATDG